MAPTPYELSLDVVYAAQRAVLVDPAWQLT
jgi:hypothetical protein